MALVKTNIKTYRTIKDLTQEDLANLVGVRRETIMRLENAKYNPSLELAVNIAKELDTTIEKLFYFE
ncbi:helix-turn-helix transcriptional regulator [Leuconostoc koreense]|nr:helix-turn-helix transcriptional regulator [Leuconostoc mesenteroides]QGM25760.1 helix-turn-helix domain-containing protein [Leuconostoc mesenteroides subsp. mesenteroides]